MKRVDIRVLGVDFHGEDNYDDLQSDFPDVYFHQTGSLMIASVFTEGDIVDAACDASTRFMHRVDGGRFDLVYEDLVGVTDISRRVGVSRELVRLWASGQRGFGGFPYPRGLIGSSESKPATKVWAWADVNRWLAQTGHDDGFDYATPPQVAQINSFLARVPDAAAPDWKSVRTRAQHVEVLLLTHHHLDLVDSAHGPRDSHVSTGPTQPDARIVFWGGGSKHGLYRELSGSGSLKGRRPK